MANWAALPVEILDEMLEKLGDIADSIRFGGVCRSWRSASVECKKKNKHWCPWMMLSETEPPQSFLDDKTLMLITMFNGEESKSVSDDDHDVPRKFVNLSTKKTMELYLPEAQGRRCQGSSFGWVLTVGLDLKIHLLNPLTRIQLSLPPLPTFQQQHVGHANLVYQRTFSVRKFALSCSPNNEQGCVVMVIYSGSSHLAFTTPGNKTWTTLKSPRGAYDDLMFFKDHFYAIRSADGVLRVCDITSSVPEAIEFMSPPPSPSERECMYYLVEMFGDLHAVLRIYYADDGFVDYVHFTVKFEVYKLDLQEKVWIELNDLGDHALFVGNNGAFVISTSDHTKLRSNSIYFTDDYYDLYEYGNSDMGLFDYREKKIVNSFYSGDGICSTFCAPMFFIPNLH